MNRFRESCIFSIIPYAPWLPRGRERAKHLAV